MDCIHGSVCHKLPIKSIDRQPANEIVVMLEIVHRIYSLAIGKKLSFMYTKAINPVYC